VSQTDDRIFDPIDISENLLCLLDGQGFDAPVKFMVHARPHDDLDKEIPLTDCAKIVNFDEGPAIFVLDECSLIGLLGPMLEYDGIHHIYLFFSGNKTDNDGNKKKVPFVMGRINANL